MRTESEDHADGGLQNLPYGFIARFAEKEVPQWIDFLHAFSEWITGELSLPERRLVLHRYRSKDMGIIALKAHFMGTESPLRGRLVIARVYPPDTLAKTTFMVMFETELDLPASDYESLHKDRRHARSRVR